MLEQKDMLNLKDLAYLRHLWIALIAKSVLAENRGINVFNSDDLLVLLLDSKLLLIFGIRQTVDGNEFFRIENGGSCRTY